MMQEEKVALVVDDDESAREFVATIMQTEGWTIIEGENGQEAVELAIENEPALIILDVNMPEMDGFEAFREIRKDFRTANTPIIMLTAINEFGNEILYDEEVMEEHFGVDRPQGFVDKPVDPIFLMNTIFGVVG